MIKCTCKKTKFATEADANTFLKIIKEKSKKNKGRKKIPIKSYKCAGGLWHLTSRVSFFKNMKACSDKVSQLQTKIEFLEQENRNLINDINKELKKEIKIDERIIELQKGILKKNAELKKSLQANSELVGKLYQLNNKNHE